MGKLTNRLEQQLKRVDHKKDAEECIEIYNWIKNTDKYERVCSSRWEPLTNVRFKGYPSDERKSVKLTINIHNRGELTINAHEARTTTPLFYC